MHKPQPSSDSSCWRGRLLLDGGILILGGFDEGWRAEWPSGCYNCCCCCSHLPSRARVPRCGGSVVAVQGEAVALSSLPISLVFRRTPVSRRLSRCDQSKSRRKRCYLSLEYEVLCLDVCRV
ncbi:hypothetical protein ElyMa_006713000 [Elysia marginata]|uniref:Uncharacterized protein n=1 Tax=Elysia marginata TaxID=1093978 RepID=A0AAV4ITQ6_9GAST|nr:hypothetical protein ElyMa_006713000 [Elysia marginata]